MKFSQLGLIQEELKLIQKPKKTTFLSSLFSAWTTESEERRMEKFVPLEINAPLLLYLRMKNLMEILPDSKFDFDVDDAFLTAGSDIVNQYGDKVSASSLYAGLKKSEGIAVHYFQEVNYIEHGHDLTPVEIHLPYSLILSLEWICDDMARYANKKAEESEVQLAPRIFKVEDILRIEFTTLVIDARDGKHEDLAKKIRYFVKKWSA